MYFQPLLSVFMFPLVIPFTTRIFTRTFHGDAILEVYQNILNSAASEKEVEIIYLDLSKAFDKVSHNLLVLNLNNYDISGCLLSRFRSYVSYR